MARWGKPSKRATDIIATYVARYGDAGKWLNNEVLVKLFEGEIAPESQYLVQGLTRTGSGRLPAGAVSKRRAIEICRGFDITDDGDGGILAQLADLIDPPEPDAGSGQAQYWTHRLIKLKMEELPTESPRIAARAVYKLLPNEESDVYEGRIQNCVREYEREEAKLRRHGSLHGERE